METPSGRPKRDTIRRRRLFTTPERSPAGSRVDNNPWSDEEKKALLEFVSSQCDSWPSYKKTGIFWKDASEYVKQQTTHRRTGEF